MQVTATPAASVDSDLRRSELVELCREMLRDRRLILVSNRGPVEHRVTADGQLRARRGTGGVVTALSALTRYIDFTWVASAMGEGDRRVVEDANGQSVRSSIRGQQVSLRYVVTPTDVYNRYYNVFSNPILWFLQHYMWNSPYTPDIDAPVYEAWENGYIPVNRAFAEAVASEAAADEAPPYIMLHDYHLYLASAYIRQLLPKATMSHFVHVPWPGPTYWMLLPDHMRTAICRGLCENDILGFQCARDVRAFLETCEEFLPEAEVDHAGRTVRLDGQRVDVHAYPISIDTDALKRSADSSRTQEHERLIEPLCADRTIVRVDRLEPSKNIIRGFKAYQLLLGQHPELHGNVTFLAFLELSRTKVREYQQYAQEVQQLVQSINTTFGNPDWTPIQVFYDNPRSRVLGGLRLYDVLLVNSVIDGMNLVAKEGPVVNTHGGVLVLSQSAGAYDQLREGAMCVAPADIEGTMQALYRAVTMSAEERETRATVLAQAVEREDLTHWLMTQMQDLKTTG